ncbi:MAG: hypothetical protein E7576_13980 [Ruminococcaceae bacterium]|nr:hypothetical protein [Oscillospiraceae bacterium]
MTNRKAAVKNAVCGILAGSLILLGAVSCGSGQTHPQDGAGASETENQPAANIYAFRMENGKLNWNQPGLPYKVNLVSAKTTPVCTDPLCMHDTEECPFFDCYGCAAGGEILFYRRGSLSRYENGFRGTEKLCVCAVADGKTRVLREYADNLVFLGVRGETLYYYTAEWSNEGDGLVCTYSLHRADGKSGAVEDLSLPETYRTEGGYIDNSDYPNLLMFEGDTIYWTKYAEDRTASILRSDLDGRNWTEVRTGVRTFASVYSEGYGYTAGIKVELEDPGDRRGENGGTVSYSLRRTRPDSGEEEPETIADNIGSSNFLVTDRYIFTMEGVSPVPEGMKIRTDPFSYGGDVGSEILNGCRVWRMNLDGSERTLVGETTEYYFAGRQGVPDKVLFDYYEDETNDWLAFFFMEQDESGRLVLSEDTLILNAETGEFTVSEFVR